MSGERQRVGEEIGIRIVPAVPERLTGWVLLRQALWPETTEQDHRAEAEALMEDPERFITFLALEADGAVIGFAEAALRRDYVNGCATSPVAFLEGIYVHPDHRRRGVARLLCGAVEEWGTGLGCSELASDADLGNIGSQRMHEALGFEETERVVYFRKPLSSLG